MKAVVMAGGTGSRLSPLTLNCPKPMLPVVNKPVLAHVLDLLKYYQITDVIITTHYLANHIQAYFGDGSHLGMKLRYIVEESPLGTAGSVKSAEPYLESKTFLVISGDIITDLNLNNLLQYHRRKQALATIALKPVVDPSQYGLVMVDSQGRIGCFREKSGQRDGNSHLVNTGIYIMEPEMLALMKPNTAYDFSRDIFPCLLSRGAPFFGYLTDAYWRDIGTLSSYHQAMTDILEGQVNSIDLGQKKENEVWLGQNVQLASDVEFSGPVYVGHGAVINSGSMIYGPTVIGDYTYVGQRTWIEESIIGQGCLLDESVRIVKAVICRNSYLKPLTLISREVAPVESVAKLMRLQMSA